MSTKKKKKKFLVMVHLYSIDAHKIPTLINKRQRMYSKHFIEPLVNQ